MNSQQRMDRANEIFARVWPDGKDRSVSDTLDDIACDVRNYGEWLEQTSMEQPEEVNDHDGLLNNLHAAGRALKEISERLESALAVHDALERQAV